MPELPEVETVVRDLRPLVTGRTVLSVRQSKHKLRHAWKPAWNAAMTGALVTGVRRRGKWILVDLKGGPVVRVHLGMTGQLTVVNADEPEPTHLHLVFELDNRTELRLRDQRRFGGAERFADRETLEAEMNAELGPEPFGLDATTFRESITSTARNLKAVLLDQKVVAGVGNIYADEVLYLSRLHPERKGKSLTVGECDTLRAAIEAVLTRAIEGRGSTIRDYVGGSGLRGGFQNEHAVYGRTGEPCPVCKSKIECVRLAGRASHYCPACQKKSSPQRTRRTQEKTAKTVKSKHK